MNRFLPLLLVLLILSKSFQSTVQESLENGVAIIAGTQKSGTTVLAALMAQHPSVQFTKYKELHYFDRAKNYEKGLGWYLKQFANATNSAGGAGMSVLAEATPFYLASREGCERIAATLPHAKLIVILREPVSRAYSEYQMKKRRVEDQDGFFVRLAEHQKQVYSCLVRHPKDYDSITKCVPRILSEHSRWTKLVTALKKAEGTLKSWNAAVNGCFPSTTTEAELVSRLAMSLERPFPQVLSSHALVCGEDDGWRMPSQERTDESDRASNGGCSATFDLASRLSLPSLPSFATYASNSTTNAMRCVRAPTFNAASCWRHHKEGLESIKSVRDAFLGETDAFQTCAAPYLQICALPTDTELQPGSRGLWTEGCLTALSRAVDACVKVQGGISTQYFYRSMYAVQLHRCYQSISPENVLIVPSGRLRRDPSQVLSEVLRFVGLEPLHDEATRDVTMEGVSAERTDNISESIKEHFPRFAASTGWRMNSDYAPMPAYLAEYMQDFFAVQNTLLFDLIGRNFTNEW